MEKRKPRQSTELQRGRFRFQSYGLGLTAINIAADYVAKHGAPSAAAPKIFFRYYFVNSSTGEKSGTMLAECKWTAAAAAGGEP